MRSIVLAAGFSVAACVNGGGDDGVTDPGKRDSTVDLGVVEETGTIIEEASADVPVGTIFDAVDDAPCTPGAKAACKTSCGTVGDAFCESGDWGKCTARAGDPCLGLDCTGKGDGLEHTWYTDSDGDGHAGKSTVQACTAPAGAYPSSDDCDDGDSNIHPGAAEVCNGKDDDCNGKVDDGVPRVVGYTLPFASVPPCNTADPASCKRGAYDWCRAKSACFSGGFGPVELGTTDGQFVCVGPGSLIGGWSDVTAAQPACSSDTQAGLRVCESAVHRAGRNKGHESAILQLHAPGDWSFLPVDGDHAKMFAGVPPSELTAKHAGCTLARVDTYDCNAATHRWCNDKGYVSGFGPVEYNTTEMVVVCVK
ncbi:MAG: putative metal-binding motif-containing protein [Polyangiales bacterium]